MTRWWLPACLALALSATACEDPPNKEMDQAQGAIDAARAAGAEQYATTEYAAATDALTRSRQAVTERDYRQALNNALESRDHAQNAAREAADTKARVRGDAERTRAEIDILVTGAEARLAAAKSPRVPAAIVREATRTLAAIRTDLQEVDDMMGAGDFLAVGPRLDSLKTRLEAFGTDLDARTASQSPRRRN